MGQFGETESVQVTPLIVRYILIAVPQLLMSGATTVFILCCYESSAPAMHVKYYWLKPGLLSPVSKTRPFIGSTRLFDLREELRRLVRGVLGAAIPDSGEVAQLFGCWLRDSERNQINPLPSNAVSLRVALFTG